MKENKRKTLEDHRGKHPHSECSGQKEITLLL